jgi:hypothetical protein
MPWEIPLLAALAAKPGSQHLMKELVLPLVDASLAPRSRKKGVDGFYADHRQRNPS